MLGKKQPNSSSRLDKKRQKFKNRYGIDYDEFMQKQREKQAKKKFGFRSIKQVLAMCKSEHKYLWACVITLFIATGVDILGAIKYVDITNNIHENIFEGIVYLILIYGICMLVTRLLWLLWQLFYNKALASINFTIKNKLFGNVLNIKTAKYNEISSGEVINRVTSDSVQFARIVADLVTNIADTVSNFAYIVVSFVFNVYLGLILVGLGMIAYMIRYIYFRRRATLNSARTKQIADKNTSLVQESVRGNKDIKNLNLKVLMNEKQTSLATNQRNSSLNEYNQAAIFRHTSWTIASISRAFIILVAIYLIQSGMTEIGIMLGVLSFTWAGLETFTCFGMFIENTKEASVCSSRMLEIMDENTYPKEHFGTKTIDNLRGEIEFKNVTFGYKKDEMLFKNLSFKIEAGQTVGIVGKSGQGKSSIINLINKLFDVNKGKILLDGEDIQTLSEDTIRENVSVVSQSPYIFDLSIKENLELVKPDATYEELVDACKKAYIYDFIMSLENKFDSKIGESGVQLSGGQKQRLAIARALLRKSKILLLDEATSALDNESQDKIKEAINNMKNEKTILIVAHRLTTVMDCDRILFIDDNTIKADGTHAELMKACPAYRKLYNKEGSEE